MKSRVGLYTLALFFAVIGASASSAPSVMADGIGGGGSGGGGGGGHQTSEGWGWRLYPLSGGGPSNDFEMAQVGTRCEMRVGTAPARRR